LGSLLSKQKSTVLYDECLAEGFGATNQLHTTKVLRLSSDLPVVVEIIDTGEKIEEFLPVLDEILTGGVVVVQDVQVRFYGPGA